MRHRQSILKCPNTYLADNIAFLFTLIIVNLYTHWSLINEMIGFIITGNILSIFLKKLIFFKRTKQGQKPVMLTSLV